MTSDAADTWELRYIAKQLPQIEASRAVAGAEPLGSAFDEPDMYVLTGSPDVNLKLRARANTLKLKVLVERTEDRFEHWRTDVDVRLPAGARVFVDMLHRLHRNGDAAALGDAKTTSEAIDLLVPIVGRARLISVAKTRRLFKRGSVKIDLVEFRVQTHDGATSAPWNSVGVEGPTHPEVREAAARLLPLGVPQNYMEFLYDQSA